MPQHDLDIANASGALVRADLNNALAALGSAMKGPNAPPAPLAGMIWVDDDTPSVTVWTVKQYDGADWIDLGRLDITNNAYTPSEGVIAWADVASAATVNLGAQASRHLRITGTTGITSFGTVPSGVRRELRFAAALTLTHNATSLILPGGANITTATGDTATAISLGSGNWVVTDFQRASALPFLNSMATARLLGRTDAGAGPTQELTVGAGLALSAGALSVSAVVRAWGKFNAGGILAASFGVSSVTDNVGFGNYTINFSPSLPSANYAIVVMSNDVSQVNNQANGQFGIVSQSTSSCQITMTAVGADPTTVTFIVVG